MANKRYLPIDAYSLAIEIKVLTGDVKKLFDANANSGHIIITQEAVMRSVKEIIDLLKILYSKEFGGKRTVDTLFRRNYSRI